MSNYEEAYNFCNVVLEGFKKNKDTTYKEFISIFPIIDFLECCGLIIKILKEDSSDALECKNGKYINQIKRFRHLAGHFRKFDTDILRLNKNKKFEVYLNNMRIFAKRVADMSEEKAQEIESNRQVRFMNPTNNKVFIVHGHNMAILQELKNFLEKSCDIKPIILSEMPDRGRTIIE